MSKKPRKRRNKKGKIKLKSGAKVVRKDKDSVRNDAIPRMQARPPADVAPTFRIKIRKK